MENSKIHIAFVGDIMPSGVLYGKDGLFVENAIVDDLRTADLRVGNFECALSPFTQNPNLDPEKMHREQDYVWAIDEDLQRVVELGINVVSLANNHAFDLCEDGLIHTMELLDANGILHCGAGRNLQEASKPAIVSIEGKTIAFLAFCDYRDETVGYVPFATENTPGLNPLYPMDYSCAEVKKYKSIYDYVFVLPHWGVEHTWNISESVRKDAKLLIDAGADGIFAHHPHRMHADYRYKGKPIFPSLGNFFFPDRYLNKPRPTWYPKKGEEPVDCPVVVGGYPWVEEPTIKAWNKQARLGLIAHAFIGDSIRTHRKYVQLTQDNVLLAVKSLCDYLAWKDIFRILRSRIVLHSRFVSEIDTIRIEIKNFLKRKR